MSALAATIVTQQQNIVVDLDGTLVLTDTFVASLFEAVRKQPACLSAIVAQLLLGRAPCKRLAARIGTLNVASLPYNEPLLKFLHQQKALGSRLILATGADSSIASDVAAHLGIFDEVISSNGECNLTGALKARAIQAALGGTPFIYAGNSRADIGIWLHSQSAILVSAPRVCSRKLQAAGIAIEREFKTEELNLRLLAHCLRIHQWSKNVLVFLPLVLAHQVFNAALVFRSLIGFLAFSFCASALYIVNDLFDLQADRLHPTKCFRPLASGKVSVGAGFLLMSLLIALTVGLSCLMPPSARMLLLVYAASSFLYSFAIKRMLFLDIVSLGLLYALRVIYGGAVTGITISVWTLAFSLFLFASLATVKRLAELRRAGHESCKSYKYRGYLPDDVNQLASLASAGGYVAVLVLALYINSPEVALLYRRPQGLWLLCPILIYWFSRLTLIANRGHLDDDPIAFALQDKATWVIGILAFIVLLCST